MEIKGPLSLATHYLSLQHLCSHPYTCAAARSRKKESKALISAMAATQEKSKLAIANRLYDRVYGSNVKLDQMKLL